jgi:thiol-disulfide isomerase/thioredoxin
MKYALAILLSIALGNLAHAADPAPDFTLKANGGGNLRLSEHRGEVILLNFWASWCGPCRQEMPLLEQLHQRYGQLGFSVIGVNVDQEPAKAEQLLRDIPVSFPVLLDNDGSVSASYAVSAMPTTILIDRDGNMRHLHRGYKPGYEETYEQQLKALIRE